MADYYNEPNLFFLVALDDPESGLLISLYMVGQVCAPGATAERRAYNAVQAALHVHSNRDGFRRRILSWGTKEFCESHALARRVGIDVG